VPDYYELVRGSSSALERIRDQRVVLAALLAIVALAFGLRVLSYAKNPRPVGAAGLTARQGEMARHVVDDGRWFVLNTAAYELLKKRQAEEGRLIDLSHVDFSSADRKEKAHPFVNQMPGIAVVLAGLWWATGNKSYSGLQWLQILIDTAMVLVVYWIAWRLTGRIGVGLLSALLYATWWKAIFFAKIPILDTWAVFFTIVSVALFLWARERPERTGRLALLGLVAGAGVYFRPFVLLVPVALALVATPGGGWRRRIAWVAVPTVVGLLVLAPWTVRNYYEFHRFIPTRTGLGQAVFDGTGQVGGGDEGAKGYVQTHKKGAVYGSPNYDDTLFKAGWQAIRNDPIRYLHQVFGRLRYLLPCLLILLVWRRWGRIALVPVAAAVATALPYVFIGGDRRFYLPVFFAYFILLAMTTDVLASIALRSRLLLNSPIPRVLRLPAQRRG
jgi:4-amino-4-deoxy-L-arabinose transferase-like glycosyltransferase